MITYLFKCFIQNEVVHVLLAIHDVSCPVCLQDAMEIRSRAGHVQVYITLTILLGSRKSVYLVLIKKRFILGLQESSITEVCLLIEHLLVVVVSVPVVYICVIKMAESSCLTNSNGTILERPPFRILYPRQTSQYQKSIANHK